MSGLLDVVSMYRQFVRVGENQIVTYLSKFTFEITFSGICENTTFLEGRCVRNTTWKIIVRDT